MLTCSGGLTKRKGCVKSDHELLSNDVPIAIKDGFLCSHHIWLLHIPAFVSEDVRASIQSSSPKSGSPDSKATYNTWT